MTQKGKINALARKFYKMQGYNVKEGYDFSTAHHPQEQLMFLLACKSFNYWQPTLQNPSPGPAKLKTIESAPKDGTFILLFGPSGYTTTPLRCQVAHYDAEYRPLHPWVTHACDSFEYDGEPATHWAPLPTYHKPESHT